MTALANVALAEFHQRTASTHAAVHAGRMRRVDGERFLRCWLSIALAAGARPGECSALLGNWVEETELDERHARIVLLNNGPPKTEWLSELARARDHAGGKDRSARDQWGESDPRTLPLSTRHHALDSLCIALDGPTESPAEQQKLEAVG